MRIDSSGDHFVATLPNNVGVVWYKGSHTANVYQGWDSTNPIDCFTFAFQKNRTSMLDFTSALQNYVEDWNQIPRLKSVGTKGFLTPKKRWY